MSQAKVYKLVQQGIDGKANYQYFTAPALPIASAQLFNGATATNTNIQIAAFDADVSTVNLAEFFAAGGMLIGPVPLK